MLFILLAEVVELIMDQYKGEVVESIFRILQI